ncbi:lipid IV(A) 3-deoxy-D-manno-octulosonic acid transferase [Vibrio fluvialis]|uniref:lipid IV(A) 3-deoxy-D-manno-octulosonic acid transferase n=1 Tax=Vibrio fluvialis TaxID=676 RepID=UPI00192ADF42|nr:lipid IV(A) 3-deoxy-D-manno-octulosonic acid transferase [Vibrio fluvialis]MBL4280016.1 lipid IV(A) 3-deoxy-D-manno-octulosonic acid transferase [Vibrio fluvialis]
MRLLYTLLLALVSPVFLYSLYKKKVGKPAFGARWTEHWGATPAVKGCAPVWIHAVSVGESIAATPLIKALKQAHPDQAIVVTTTTSTGAEQIAKLGDLVEHRYMPLDFTWCVRRFIRAVQPSQLLIVETELWPNTLQTVHQSGVPVTVINARLSERSCQRYQKFSALFGLIRPYVDRVLCQYSSDAERFVRLGFDSDQVQVTGSVKFDIDVPASTVATGQQFRQQLGASRPVWIAASTHEGEDARVLDAHQALLTQFPDALLILVPRHPERFNSVYDLCVEYGLSTHRRTSPQAVTAGCQVYLADTMGEMLALLSAADLCFMGGSLLGNKVGGHNVLEPAALRVPVVIGPSYFNFQEIVDTLHQQQAIEIIPAPEALPQALLTLFSAPDTRVHMSNQAMTIVESSQGAIVRTIGIIDQTLKR